jgi:Tfp pilus assembly protein FimT
MARRAPAASGRRKPCPFARGLSASSPRAIRGAAARRAGFSLVELMGVIIILGLIGSVAMMSWQSLLPGAKVNAAIRNLSEALAGARSEAISRNARFEVWYDLDGEGYWVRTPYRIGGGFATADDDEFRVIIDETDLAEVGLSIDTVTIDEEVYVDGIVHVRFDALGASSAHTVVLHHAAFDQIHTIEVLPLTGEIRHHDGLYERDRPREGDFD